MDVGLEMTEAFYVVLPVSPEDNFPPHICCLSNVNIAWNGDSVFVSLPLWSGSAVDKQGSNLPSNMLSGLASGTKTMKKWSLKKQIKYIFKSYRLLGNMV